MATNEALHLTQFSAWLCMHVRLWLWDMSHSLHMFWSWDFFAAHALTHAHIHRVSPRVAVRFLPGSAGGGTWGHVRSIVLILSGLFAVTYDTRMPPFLRTISLSALHTCSARGRVQTQQQELLLTTCTFIVVTPGPSDLWRSSRFWRTFTKVSETLIRRMTDAG